MRRRSSSGSIYPNNAQRAKTDAGPNLRKNWATEDHVHARIAANIAKLPGLLGPSACGRWYARIIHPQITHQREKQMKNFILFLAIVCGGVTVMFYTAAKEAADGPNWASKLCSASRSLSLCQDPRQLAFVAGGLGILWLSPAEKPVSQKAYPSRV